MGRSARSRLAVIAVVAPLLLTMGWGGTARAEGERRLTIIAMNDFHGALYELPDAADGARAYGGLPWLVGAVAALRAEVPGLLLLDGGDAFQGSWPVNATRGQGSVDAFRLLGVDASAIGNHEFDYGGAEGGHPLRGALEAAAKGAGFPWLTANVEVVDGGEARPWQPEGIRPWTIIERGGVKVGLIGLTTTETPSTTRPENVVDLRFGDPVAAVRRLAPEVRAAGAEVIVVLGHLTGECGSVTRMVPGGKCTPDGEIGHLLSELPEGTIDVIVSGHAHTLLSTRVGRTFVAQAWAQGRALVRVDLVIGQRGVDADRSTIGSPWLLLHDRVDPGCEGGELPLKPRDVGGRTVTPSGEAAALIRRLEEQAGGSPCEKVACATAPLVRNRAGESAVGDLMADAMRAGFEGADAAVQNSGGLRADVPAGVVRRSHVQDVMPFDNAAVLLEMTGEKLRLMLRIGTSGAHGALQVSGLRYSYDPARVGGSDLDGHDAVADWEKDRLCGVTVGGEPLDPKKTYKVVVADFLLSGGDHLGPAFVGARVVAQGPLLRDLLEAHLRRAADCIDPSSLLAPKAPRIGVGTCPVTP